MAHHFLRLHAFAFGRLVAWNTICRDLPASLSSLFLLSNSCILICSVSPPSSTSRDRDRDATLVASDSTPAGAGSRDSRGRPAESRGSRGFHTERWTGHRDDVPRGDRDGTSLGTSNSSLVHLPRRVAFGRSGTLRLVCATVAAIVLLKLLGLGWCQLRSVNTASALRLGTRQVCLPGVVWQCPRRQGAAGSPGAERGAPSAERGAAVARSSSPWDAEIARSRTGESEHKSRMSRLTILF